MPSTRERRQLVKQQRHEQRRDRKRRAIQNRPPEKPQQVAKTQGILSPNRMSRKMRIGLIITSMLIAIAFILGTPGLMEVLTGQQ